jgi:hypothetical protein
MPSAIDLHRLTEYERFRSQNYIKSHRETSQSPRFQDSWNMSSASMKLSHPVACVMSIASTLSASRDIVPLGDPSA